MNTFSSGLLREKFTIFDPQNAKTKMTAQGNRFVLDLYNPEKENRERFVVRGQNMHSVIRMASRIIYDFNKRGAIEKFLPIYDWDGAWKSIVNEYEYAHNLQRWVAVYAHGKPVFQSDDHHPLFDIIEKCAHNHDKGYDDTIPIAEKLLQETGKNLRIDYDTNVALSVNVKNNQGNFGIILRGTNNTNTFNFTVKPKKEKKDELISVPQCLNAAAAFLEGIQLTFQVGTNIEKIRRGIIERFSKEEKQTTDGQKRLQRLTGEISSLESAFSVRYRPEKPEFAAFLAEAEELANKMLESAENEGGDTPPSA